jgi:cell volume regulation protein A
VNQTEFALVVLVISAAGIVAVLSNRLTDWLRVPAPALMLIGAAVLVKLVPDLHEPPEHVVEDLVTIALLCILFDGGMHIGLRRLRAAAVPIAVVGVIGTFVTVAGAAVFAHYALGLAWYVALLVATAIAPTDPAVVFSVLGQREVSGRSGTILEGESGANDPVGIALMASLVSAGHLSGGAFGHVAWEFVVQMVVGVAMGAVGGRALMWFMRVPLPSEGLYPIRTLACASALFGITTLAHGSGFLAVFVAGIVVGDERAPYKREIERFHSALASLGEIVAFIVLGLTVDVREISHADVWVPGLILAIVLSFVVRPLLVGPCLAGTGLTGNEKTFVLFAGLKGAVPILLGTTLLTAHIADAHRFYGIVVVVVTFSVIVQGSLVPGVAAALRIPMRIVEQEPFAVGVRLRDEPDGVHRLLVAEGSAADGRRIRDFDVFPEDAWISVVVRDGQLVAATGDTTFQPGDLVLVLADPALEGELSGLFCSAADRS